MKNGWALLNSCLSFYSHKHSFEHIHNIMLHCTIWLMFYFVCNAKFMYEKYNIKCMEAHDKRNHGRLNCAPIKP